MQAPLMHEAVDSVSQAADDRRAEFGSTGDGVA